MEQMLMATRNLFPSIIFIEYSETTENNKTGNWIWILITELNICNLYTE